MRQASLNRGHDLFFTVVCRFWIAGVGSIQTPPIKPLSCERILADIVVLQQAARASKIVMSTSPEPGPMNGHTSPSGDEDTTHVADFSRSDSDLSDTQPAEVDAASSDSDDAAGSADEGPAFTTEEQDDQSGSTDNDGPGDEDFDAPGSPASGQGHDVSDEAESASAHAAAKRKSGQTIEDDFMRENPELYGLRRSSRPSQRRKLVDSEDEEEGSDFDTRLAPRKTTTKRRRLERSLPSMSGLESKRAHLANND
jgi:chromodomain-helicase-DNA-binding protein 1